MPTPSATVQAPATLSAGSTTATARRAVATTPIGDLLLVARSGAICEIRLPEPSADLLRTGEAPPADAPPATDAAPVAVAVLEEARRQLDEYFAGARREFDLPLLLEGTAFQRLVWGELRCVGYGQTVTYAELARAIGRPRAARAVGAALGRNPLPIVLPCHRVIGARGDLRGFAGGIALKRRLLEREAAHLGA